MTTEKKEAGELSSLFYEMTEDGLMQFTMVDPNGTLHQDIYRQEAMNDLVRYWLNATLPTDNSFTDKQK